MYMLSSFLLYYFGILHQYEHSSVMLKLWLALLVHSPKSSYFHSTGAYIPLNV